MFFQVLVRDVLKNFSVNILQMGYYSTAPLKLGVEVRGVDLKYDISPEVLEKIKSDVIKHRLLVFKDQGIIEGKRQVQISQWFGSVISTFYRHPKSPDLDVFRVSNVESEGCRNVGRTGWHIDGSFLDAPYSYSLYHIISVPHKGDTVFAPLTELIENLGCEKRRRWERLWMVSDRRECVVHPLIYSHPISKKKILCFHLGMTEAFIWDYGKEHERLTSSSETMSIINEIHHEFVKNNKAIQYSHKWEAGDFIISDNLALGHEASPETQHPVEEVGLRVMHRTTVAGTAKPTKFYPLEEALKCTCGKCKDK